MSLTKVYAKKLHNEFGYFGILEPGEVKLGDIIDPRTFKKIGNQNIRQEPFNIEFEEEVVIDDKSRSREFDREVSSRNDVSVGAIAELALGFKGENSVYFSANGCVKKVIKNLLSFAEKIAELYKTNKKVAEYFIVTEIICADKTAIIMSLTKNATVKFNVKALPIAKRLADMSLDSELVQSDNAYMLTTEKKSQSVMFDAKRIKRRYLFGPVEFRGDETDEDDTSSDVWEDLCEFDEDND